MRQNLMRIANHIVCIGCYDYIKGIEIHQCEMCTLDFKEVGWSRMSLSFRSDWPIWTSARQLLLAQIKFKWSRLKVRNITWTEINNCIQPNTAWEWVRIGVLIVVRVEMLVGVNVGVHFLEDVSLVTFFALNMHNNHPFSGLLKVFQVW